MLDPDLDSRDRAFVSGGMPSGFFEAPFLREILDDLTSALELGRPVFLLGEAGIGKSSLADGVACLLGRRYGVARLAGRRLLGLDELVEACRLGFSADAWDDLSARQARPGDNLLIVDPADEIPARFVEQIIAVSNGSPDLLPSHRVLLVGRDDLAAIAETSRVRNNWGDPLMLHIPSWPDGLAAPFLRHRLRSAGMGDPDLLSDAAIDGIAAGAGGNPGRLLDGAGRILQPEAPDEPERIDLSTEPLDAAMIIDLEPVAPAEDASVTEPAPIVFAEPALAMVPEPPPELGALVHLPVDPRRVIHRALPGVVVVAAGLLVWAIMQPSPAPPSPPPQVAAALVPASALLVVPPPPPLPTPAPAPEPAPVPIVALAYPPALVPAPADTPTVPTGTLIARGDALLAGGDFAAARLFYMQAARAGSANAATSVARTFDPLALSRMGVVGDHGEPGKAAEWYRKAVELGDPAAADPLRRLSQP